MHDETTPNEARPDAERVPSTPIATPTSGTGGAPEPVLASHSVSAAPTTQAGAAPEPWQATSTTPSSGTWDSYQAEQPSWERTDRPFRLFGMGVGTLAMLGGAAGGTWYYRRWQRERNRPINRLRRQMRSLAKAAGERMPDRAEIMDRLPDREMARPMGGVGTGMLLLALLAARAMRSGRADDEPEVAHLEVELARNGHHDGSANGHDASFWERLPMTNLRPEDMAARGGELLSTARERVQTMEMPASRSAGLGVGGALALAALGYLVWRMLNGDESDLYQGWHSEATSGDVIRNP